MKIVRIPCICNDGKIHYCVPHENTSFCGKPVISKKLGKTDHMRDMCYSCDITYIKEEGK